MATKVGILDSHQDISDKPAESRKRSYAEGLVRRLMMEKINDFLYRRLIVKPASLAPAKYTSIPKAYTGLLPPAEVPGVIFKDPAPGKSARRFFVLAANRIAANPEVRA